MFEPGKEEWQVLGCLIHAETVETVVRETGLPVKVVIDIVRNLFHYRFIKPVNDKGREVPMFEIDAILDVRFMLSSKGYSALEKHMK